MFTGIVEDVGCITSITQQDNAKILLISSQKIVTDMHVGDSIAVSGCCLTVTDFTASTFTVTMVAQTLRCTMLGALQVGDHVNLERAMLPTTRIGGHFVQGHIDGTTCLVSWKQEGVATMAEFVCPEALAPFIQEKGFVALDGMSLTVAERSAATFCVSFIPHTIDHTIVQYYDVGRQVNLEVDMLVRAVLSAR